MRSDASNSSLPTSRFRATALLLASAWQGGAVAQAATLPEPPAGYRWIANEAFSDEFAGTELDTAKWHDHNPQWEGRAPGKFMPSAVSVVGGNLRIKSTPLDPPDGPFNVACGAVQSRATDAHFGYYECRMKASSIRTSSTFWLTSGKSKPCRYGSLKLEIDIQESVGDATRWSSFKTNVHCNTHIKLAPNKRGKAMLRRLAEENPTPESKLKKLDSLDDTERAKALAKIEDNRRTLRKGETKPLKSPVDAEFHTYGCWWVDANTLKFYADGEPVATVEPATDFHPEPFDHPLRMNLVCETYDWETPPSVEQLNDDTINTTLYDYVRSYTLEKIEPAAANSGSTGQ